MKRGRTIFAALFAAAIVATACGGAGTGGTGATTAARPAVIVGSTNFYEQITLGELYAQVLEANGYKVTRKFNLGNREIVYPAIKSGQIDVVAEYLATLLAFVDKDGKIAKPTTDKSQTATGLQKALDAEGLTDLDPADATDQNGFVVSKDTASSRTLKKLLNSISAKLTEAELNDMNKQVAVDKKDNKDVAAAWLKKQGLIK